MTNYPVETFETTSYGLGTPNPYPFGIPEELPKNAFSTALASSLLVFSGQGRLCGFTASSTKGSGQFIQVFNASTIPATGAVTPMSFDIATVTAKGVAFDPYGRWFTVGCIIANSTTQGSFTPGLADCLFDAQYIPQVI